MGCSRNISITGRPNSSYHELLPSFTREARFFGLEKVRYLTSVTYKSKTLREAYVEEYSKKYELSEEEKIDLLKKEMEEADQYDIFLISHYATDKDTGKLTKEAKVWDFILSSNETEGKGSHPDSIKGLMAKDTVLQYFYPQITPWSKVYEIKFKRGSPVSELRLKMVGVVDQLSFVWHEKIPDFKEQ